MRGDKELEEVYMMPAKGFGSWKLSAKLMWAFWFRPVFGERTAPLRRSLSPVGLRPAEGLVCRGAHGGGVSIFLMGVGLDATEGR